MFYIIVTLSVYEVSRNNVFDGWWDMCKNV